MIRTNADMLVPSLLLVALKHQGLNKSVLHDGTFLGLSSWFCFMFDTFGALGF